MKDCNTCIHYKTQKTVLKHAKEEGYYPVRIRKCIFNKECSDCDEYTEQDMSSWDIVLTNTQFENIKEVPKNLRELCLIVLKYVNTGEYVAGDALVEKLVADQEKIGYGNYSKEEYFFMLQNVLLFLCTNAILDCIYGEFEAGSDYVNEINFKETFWNED